MMFKGFAPSRRMDDLGGVAIEYSLIGAALGIGLISALVGVKSSLKTDFNRIGTAIYQTRLVSAPAVTSTLVSTVATTVSGYPGTRMNYVNSDGTTRFTETINDPSKLSQYQVSGQDVYFDANGNLFYRTITTVSGDFPSGGQGQLIDSGFVYTGPNSYSFHEQSANLAAYAWSDVTATVTNGRLTSQVVQNLDGGRYRTDFTYDAQGNVTTTVTNLP